MNTQTFNHTPHKCRKKLLSWLLVLCLCLGLLPTSAWADETSTSISEIKFSIDEPKAGETPAQTAESLTDGIEVDNIAWRKLIDGEDYPFTDETFENKTTYLLNITAVVEPGYPISKTAITTVNGKDAFFSYDHRYQNKGSCKTFGAAEFSIYPEYPSPFDIWLLFTVTDQQQEQTYSVTVKTDGRGDAFASSSSGRQDENIDLTYKAADGWHFNQWTLTSGTGAKLQGNTLTIGSSDVTVTAEFEQDKQLEPEPKPAPEPTYRVEVKTTGQGEAHASPTSGKKGDTITLYATADEGWKLKRWVLLSLNGAALTDNILTLGDGGVVVQAEFEQIEKPVPTYSVVIETDGHGSVIPSASSGKYGDQITLTIIPDDGWKLKGWHYLQGDGASISGNILTIGSGNINVQAEFVAVTPPDPTYTITVETSGHGTASASAKSGKQGETVALTAAADEGYQFKGWTLLHGEDAVLTGDLLTIGSGNVTVRADFEPLPPPEPIYTVTVETDGHGTASSSARSGKYRDTVTLNATPDTGWRLKTWHIVQGMDSFVTDNVLTIGTENMTVRAEFEPGDPVYTCRWNANGGSWASGAVTRTGLSLPSPAPTRSGWTFSGWYTSPDGGDRLEDTPYFRSGRIDGLDDNIVFYAHWTQNAPAPSGGGGGGGGGGGSAAPAASPSVSGADAAASSARFSSALTAGEQAVGRIRPRGLPALTPASAMPRTAVWLLRLLALLPGGAS